MIEEDLIAEEEIVTRTVAVKASNCTDIDTEWIKNSLMDVK